MVANEQIMAFKKYVVEWMRTQLMLTIQVKLSICGFRTKAYCLSLSIEYIDSIDEKVND